MTIKDGSYLKKVREQYESYPYPHRDPESEKNRLIFSFCSSLDSINYHCFGGGRDFSKGMRVLVAGGGTGDCTIYLAEQLRGTPSEIVYLDMSTASMAVAKERAAIRKLDNITWINDSLLNISSETLGKFDYISCTGVLHHLENPQKGLDALKSVLDEAGAMYIMVYARYGRAGVYQMQDLLRKVNQNVEDVEQEIEHAKTLCNTVAGSHWFKYAHAGCQIDLSSDNGVFDLLLHSQDRSYTIPELYEYVESSGLTISKLANFDHALGDLLFEPKTFIRDPGMLAVIDNYSFQDQAAICEMLFGQLMKQQCYLSLQHREALKPENLQAVPVIATAWFQNYEKLKKELQGGAAQVKLNELVSIKNTRYLSAIFDAIDGKRTIKKVVNTVMAKLPKSSQNFEQIYHEFIKFYEVMSKVNGMYLLSDTSFVYPTVAALEQRVSV